jgi:hypothetical protein
VGLPPGRPAVPALRYADPIGLPGDRPAADHVLVPSLPAGGGAARRLIGRAARRLIGGAA